jgi:hypothetical protein
VALASRAGVRGFLDLVARLLLEDEQRGQADDQRKQQHRQDGKGQDFGLQTQAHGSLFFFYWRG